jgi:hypothetical protein
MIPPTTKGQAGRGQARRRQDGEAVTGTIRRRVGAGRATVERAGPGPGVTAVRSGGGREREMATKSLLIGKKRKKVRNTTTKIKIGIGKGKRKESMIKAAKNRIKIGNTKRVNRLLKKNIRARSRHESQCSNFTFTLLIIQKYIIIGKKFPLFFNINYKYTI